MDFKDLRKYLKMMQDDGFLPESGKKLKATTLPEIELKDKFMDIVEFNQDMGKTIPDYALAVYDAIIAEEDEVPQDYEDAAQPEDDLTDKEERIIMMRYAEELDVTVDDSMASETIAVKLLDYTDSLTNEEWDELPNEIQLWCNDMAERLMAIETAAAQEDIEEEQPIIEMDDEPQEKATPEPLNDGAETRLKKKKEKATIKGVEIVGKDSMATNKTIREIYKGMDDGSLVIKPDFQRNAVWSNKHKSEFIRTILMNLPFPEIYFASIESENVTEAKTLVIDGQQRLATIYEYITGAESFKPTKIPKFDKLAKAAQQAFMNYKVVVRELGSMDSKIIIEIFKRINSTAYSLNKTEINHAIYKNGFMQTAKDLQGDFAKLNIFSEQQIKRMKDLEFILVVMATLENKEYFGGSALVSSYLGKFETEYSNAAYILKNVRKAIEMMVENTYPDSPWRKQTMGFTLLVETARYLMNNGLPDMDQYKKVLANFAKNLTKNENEASDKNDFTRFLEAVNNNTSAKNTRTLRGSIISNALKTLKEK